MPAPAYMFLFMPGYLQLFLPVL